MYIRFISILIILISTTSYANNKVSTDLNQVKKKSKVISWGHNLAPTTNTLDKGGLTAGIYIVGYGLTENLMIGTSPWFNHYYNMNNAVIKTKLYADELNSIAFQSAYFKSNNKASLYENDKYYQMEASLSNLIYSRKVNSVYSVSTNIGYHYYFDETVPFSVRRESFNNQPHQWNLSTFHEIDLEDSYSFGFEVGALGLNYLYPQLITGASFNYKGRKWQMQLGMSFTGTPKAYISSESIDNNKELYGYTSQYKEKGKLDFSAHPEIQLQYYF